MPSDQLTTRTTALILVALGLLPVANLLPGGETDPAYARRLSEWGNGTAICLGVAVVAVILLRERLRSLTSTRCSANSRGSEVFFTLIAGLGSFGLYCWVALSVFSARPLLIDEIVQVMQAKIYASGHLWLPVAAHREFFSGLHVVDTGDKVYSQFPPGGPAMLALGELVHATWLVGPACGAASVVLFERIVQFTDPGASRLFRWSATLLFAAAPFGAFMFGSHMNHTTALMFILVAVVGLSSATTTGSASARTPWALLCGLGLGAAATIRPLDAFAFALPAGAWLLVRAVRQRNEVCLLLASSIGIAIPFGLMMWVNAQTTGSPLLFGYEVLWGKTHGLGFHSAPWGAAHTPARGLELISLYVTRLQTYFLETPFPALLPAIASLAITRKLSTIDRYLLASAALLGALYFAYWHDGFFLGPRFVFSWLPVLVLWTVRLPWLVRERFGAGPAWIGTIAFLVTGMALAAAISLPLRVGQYRSGLTSMRVNYTDEANRARVRDALVFVRESWGAQLVTRLWERGVSRSATAALYHDVDACVLDKALRDIERESIRGLDAERRLAPLRRDSTLVRSSPFSPDSTERILPGANYDQVCITRLNEDRAGYTHLAPLLLERSSGNTYARDLHARDSLLVAEHPSASVYLLRRKGTEADATFEWLPLKRDSLYAAWRSGAP